MYLELCSSFNIKLRFMNNFYNESHVNVRGGNVQLRVYLITSRIRIILIITCMDKLSPEFLQIAVLTCII